MNWFICAVVCTVGWSFSDLFSKKGADPSDRRSHLRQAVWTGLVLGVASLVLLAASGRTYSPSQFLHNALVYLPVSACYMISMIIGYAGLRYLEVSIVSPVQNGSGALAALIVLVWHLVTRNISAVFELAKLPDLLGSILIFGGVIALAVTERRAVDVSGKLTEAADNRKYRHGFRALMFPILYCVFDAVGTALDGILLEGRSDFRLDETEVLILYGITFLTAAVICWVWLWIKERRPYLPFRPCERPKALAGTFETFGQLFYVYAMAGNPLLSPPIISSSCALSVLLGRIILKEKLCPAQYVCIGAVICGIVLPPIIHCFPGGFPAVS